MRSIYGLSAAIAAAGLLASHASVRVTSDANPSVRPGSIPFPFDPGPVPNDIGPVIDTTPESKRARRRRLAKQGGQDHG